MNLLLFWLYLTQPHMVGRYMKDSCARERRFFLILFRGWMVHAKETSNKELKFVITLLGVWCCGRDTNKMSSFCCAIFISKKHGWEIFNLMLVKDMN